MATNATKVSSSIEASCKLCTNFFSDPRMLPCLHTFCCNCLKKHFEKEKSDSHLCPTCEVSFEIPEGSVEALPKDLRSIYEADVAHLEEKIKNPSGVSCDRCIKSSESVAVRFCCNCCKFLCKCCTEDHMRWQITYEHELVEVGEGKEDQNGKGLLNSVPHKEMNCQLHSDEKLKFYCKTCSCLICRDCVVLSHNGHKYERMEKIAEEERSDLMSFLAETDSAGSDLQDAMAQIQKVIQSVKTKQKSVDDQIKDVFKNLRDVLYRREELLLAKCSEVGLGKVTALSIQSEEIKKISKDIVKICGKIKEAAQIYTPAEMLSAKGAMAAKLKNLMQQFKSCSLEPCKNDTILVSLNGVTIEEQMEKFGAVTGGCFAGGSTASIYIPQAIKGKEKKILVTARDLQGKLYPNGGEVVKAKLGLIGSDDFDINGEVKDNQDGTYVVSITPQTTGEHQLSITIRNENIKCSPFTLGVREPRTYTSLSCQRNYSISSQTWDVAISDNEEIFITNYGQHCIEVKNKSGGHIRIIGRSGSYGSENGQFQYPSGIAIQGDVIYVADQGNSRVQKLTTQGKFLSKFGSSGSGDGQLSTPREICIDPKGLIYISEYGNNRISVFKADGTFDHHITGNLNDPRGIAFDSSGNLHVASYGNSSVIVFTPEGKESMTYGSGVIQNPSGIAIDPEGYVFISEYRSTSSRLFVFDPKHKKVNCITGFNYASGISLDSEGFIYIADYSNCRVCKY